MASEVKLPRLGQGMESGTIVKWLKSEGEAVEKGEPLYELDTDKVTQEVEAEASGVLLKIAVPEGEVEVGRTIGFIGAQGETVADSPDGDSAKGQAPAPEEQAPDVPAPATNGASKARVVEAIPEPGGRIKASPLARRIARERGIELSGVRGTGPDGRIVAEDVDRGAAQPAAAVAAAPSGEVESRPLTSIRKTIARRLTEAWTVPAFQLTVEVVDPRTLQPLDEETLVASVKKTNRAVVAHEAVTRMGFGAEVAAVLQYQAFDWLDAPVERVGARFTPLPFAPVMEQFVIPHADDVLQAIFRTVNKKA